MRGYRQLDVSYFENVIGTVVEDLVKAGWTARNSNGDAIFWDSLCLGMTSSALEAEALALLAVV